MKNPCKHALIAAALSVSLALPQLVHAESTTATGAGTVTADARVDFRIIIPGVLRFRVGAAGGGIDLIDFAPTAANLGTGTDVAATAGSGDQGNGDVTVEVLSNSGQITISHDSNAGFLSDGGINTIPYTEILTASNSADLGAPALGTPGTTLPTLNGELTNETATWTYTYDNTVAYNSGIYGGAGVNNGRVTYTASSP